MTVAMHISSEAGLYVSMLVLLCLRRAGARSDGSLGDMDRGVRWVPRYNINDVVGGHSIGLG